MSEFLGLPSESEPIVYTVEPSPESAIDGSLEDSNWEKRRDAMWWRPADTEDLERKYWK